MLQNSQHLISRLTWDTRFDSKAQGLVLQERLSDWSGFHLQQELLAVFDKFCPPEQTWKIESLELDLGTIDFDCLESELPIKIRQQLNEKLTALILYSNQRDKYIEILDERKSHIQLIRYFLRHGSMPWNHQPTDSSINQILTLQLQNNLEELLTTLKELGFSAEQVRRRMAWQFNEPNMVKIITAIEPNVGGQIIMFSNELTLIQQKATVVQVTSTADFKQNIWFWVLNYLLTERGTVFNRIQFMKSTIKQMAAHYNMQYDELFGLIELAVAKLNRSLNLQPDFIRTLQLLSKENKVRQKKKVKPIGEDEDHWVALKALFQDQNLRRTTGNLLIFNDLVTALSKQDKLRFKNLVGSFGNSGDFWLPLINELSDHSLKTIFISLKDSRSVLLTESILFLNRLMGKGRQRIERNELWHKGLMFILEHKNRSFKEIEFLEVLIAVLAQNKQCAPLVLLDQLLVAEVPISLKTLRHTALYRILVNVFMIEISRIPILQFKKHLQQLMELFHLQVKGGIKDRKRFEALKNILENYKMLQPKAFKEALAATPYQNSLQSAFPIGMSSQTTTILNLSVEMAQTALQQFPVIVQSAVSKDTLASMIDQPEQLLEFVKKEIIAEPQWHWLYEMLGFDQLLKMMSSLHPSKQTMFNSLQQFDRVLAVISIKGISADEMQYLLFKKVTKAWTSGNWKLIIAQNIWNELIWEICGKRGVSKREFLATMDVQKLLLPPLLRLSLESLMAQDRATVQSPKIPISKTRLQKPSIPVVAAQDELLKGGISIRNAGLVLLNSYISMLLTRLELIKDHSFCSAESQLHAIHYLQYVVTGLTHTEESLLPLNKLLCGIPLSQPVPDSIVLSPDHQELIEGMIAAVIGHWPAIGSCSVDGFRGNWLVRDGLLIEKEDRWELTVEKRAYDLLIHKSPFSFSVIRYPWMNKPLHVNWPY